MDVARGLAREARSRGRVVIADRQGSGRGRAGRPFVSPPGGLYLTAELDPLEPAGDSWRLGLCAALAARDAIGRVSEAAPRLSWPNDLYLGEQKVAGVLVELVTTAGAPSCALVGVGINVDPPTRALEVPEAGPAGPLPPLPGPDPVARLGAELLRELERLDGLVRGGARWPRVLESVRDAMAESLGRSVLVRAHDGREIRGRTVGIADDGALLVETGAGRIENVRHGEIQAD